MLAQQQSIHFEFPTATSFILQFPEKHKHGESTSVDQSSDILIELQQFSTVYQLNYTSCGRQFKWFDCYLMQPQQQQITLIKSPKLAGQSILSLPLSLQTQGINQTKQKLKQLHQKAGGSGCLLQKCESSQSLHGTNAKKQQSKQKVLNENSLSPSQKQGSLQRTGKHNRQSTTVNFNISNSVTKNQHHKHQKSLSPTNNKSNVKQQQQNHVLRMSSERVKSTENQSIEIIQKTSKNAQNEGNSIEKEKRTTQHIRISPQKQFIVQPSITSQTSPQEQFKKQSMKLSLKNPYSTKSNNVILEQDDYLLPNSSQSSEAQDYSLKKDYKKMINHNQNMKGQLIHQAPKDSEESVNKGFLTDRQQASCNEIENHIMMDTQQRQKKTKGISYTRNAQELKKLLLETGVIGNLGLTSSLATAAAGMISSTQDTQYLKNIDLSKTGQNTHQSQTAKVKHSEIFSFSARNKTGINKVSHHHHHKSSEKISTCILENKMMNSKAQHKRMQSQLENSVQTQKPMINGLFQTLDKNMEMGNYPSSTQNNQQQQHKLRDFILKDDEESNHQQYNHYLDDQVIFKSKRQSPKSTSHHQNIPSKRSPSNYLNNKEDVSSSNINFPFTETEQLIYRNESKQNHQYSGSVIDVQKKQRVLNRCWTAHGDISTERENNKENFFLKDADSNINFYQQPQIQFENSQIDSVGGAPVIPFTFQIQNNQNLSSQKQSQQNQNFIKRQSGISSQSKNTCFTYNQAQSPITRYPFSSMISDENTIPNRINQQKYSLGDMKELEIMKFKMIAFVKTYQNEFQKMKLQMNELSQENKSLKRKLNHMSMRRTSVTSNKTSQSTSIAVSKAGYILQNPTCLTSAHTSQINL
ncbi:UNKNOWN [Stylonychia lemnae]|uniref:Uncharacterized protein n=1 Tax=Stylonychia lemnae TaxID=5949 RepID=A0A078AWR1_STYLE|nr:UNKNOWN [Stylonychia lemnae]|eukprot:CDW86486.1 UNKNOWN [Stylonychia lemnae]